MKSITQIVNCPICGLEFDLLKHDVCRRCRWWWSEGEELWPYPEKEPNNSMTIREAKKLYSQGLTIFGDKIETEKGDA